MGMGNDIVHFLAYWLPTIWAMIFYPALLVLVVKCIMCCNKYLNK